MRLLWCQTPEQCQSSQDSSRSAGQVLENTKVLHHLPDMFCNYFLNIKTTRGKGGQQSVLVMLFTSQYFKWLCTCHPVPSQSRRLSSCPELNSAITTHLRPSSYFRKSLDWRISVIIHFINQLVNWCCTLVVYSCCHHLTFTRNSASTFITSDTTSVCNLRFAR